MAATKSKIDIQRISDDKDLITDTVLLAKYISDHDKKITNKYQSLWNAYACNARILDTSKVPAKANYKPDHRIAVNYPRYVVDTYNGFAAGIPVKITSEDQSVEEYVEHVYDYNEMADIIAETHKLKCIFGESYQIVYFDEDEEMSIAVTDPLEAFPIYTNSIKPALRYFVRTYYDEDNKRHGTISDSENVYYFDFGAKGIEITETQPHGFAGVPAVVYVMNSARTGLIELILSMCDAYDKSISEKMNDVDAFADAIMKVQGVELSEKQLETLRDKRIINVAGRDGASALVDFMARPSGDSTQENLLERLERLIFTISMVCNVSDPNFATSSGIALRMKMEPMSNLAAGDWRIDQAALKKLWRLIFSNPAADADQDAWSSLKFSHYLNYPDDVNDSVDIAVKLASTVSKETQLAILPASIVPDVDAEMQRIKDEQAESVENAMTAMQGQSETTEETKTETETKEEVTTKTE